ncbi:hypothetical protein [Massilia sp. H6]|uniref:hypothetical protein n=1 Tax=Massilia sp. H6 TaxID=2970464 RepID=UPI002166F9F1|nr:hypothetical protein [Massilia sp. H6]UVW28241.1 hypothetical protein NRS07_17225 [Massilia sp. H6]
MNLRETPHAVACTVEWEFAHSTYAQVLADVPAALFFHWAQSARIEFPGIPRDASFYAQAVEGLMVFFDCAAAASRPCALPSRAADSVWQAWACMDAPSLERFCIRHVGKAIAYAEPASMEQSVGEALGACLVQARRRASCPVAGNHLPRLFALDAQLGMPRGFGYRIINGRIACSTLDELGVATSARFPEYLTAAGLYRSGLITAAEYNEASCLGLPEPQGLMQIAAS